MALWIAVNGIVNGEQLIDSVINRPIYQLTERTNYLYGRIQSVIGSGLFESVRAIDITLETVGSLAPVVGDIVYLNPTTGKYEKALANVGTDVFTAALSSYAVGMVITASAGVGTLVLFGNADLTGWVLSTLMEEGETYRDGAYYLSALNPGKLTANPSGPVVYVGQFQQDADNPGYGGYAMLNFQNKDMALAHRHVAYPMYSQPAGTQAVTGLTPADTHSVLGFESIDPTGTMIPRLVLLGTFTGDESVTYTLWLSNSSDPDEVLGATVAPTDWSDAYLHWASSDVLEGTGCSRVWSFDSVVSIGSKGVMAALELSSGSDWDAPYTPGTDAEDKRTWSIVVPDQTAGWLAKCYRQYFDTYTTGDYSFLLHRGPQNSTGRTADTITMKCLELHELVYTTNPTDTKTVTIGAYVFEFDDNGATTPGNIPVSIGADVASSMTNLVNAIVSAKLVNVDAGLEASATRVIIGTPASTTVSTTVTGATTSTLCTGAGDLITGDVGVMIYDMYHNILLATDAGAIPGLQYYQSQALANGLEIMPIPYDSAGVVAPSDAVAIGDSRTIDITDEAPTAYFWYNVGMHAAMNQYFPPIPVEAASLVLNGIELDSYNAFPTDPTYRLGNSAVNWYPRAYGAVPWPRDWVDISSPGTFDLNMLLHFVRSAIGNTGVVTSLRPVDGSPVRVVQCGTNTPATVGDLAIDVDLDISDSDQNLAGYKVYKATTGQKLIKGPVVEKIVAGPGISITQQTGHPTGQGIVTIGSSGSYAGEFEEVALQNAKQELMGMFPYVQLLGWTTGGSSNVPTAFVAKFRVPHNIGDMTAPPSFKVVVHMTVFGETSIPWVGGGNKKYAGIDFSYSILPDFFPVNIDPAWNVLNGTLPDGMLTMATPIRAEIPFGKYDPAGGYPIYSAYDPMLIHNNPSESPVTDDDRKIAWVLGYPFPVKAALYNWTLPDEPVVKPGSLVGIRVARADVVSAIGQEYTGKIGFINIRWMLIPY